MMHQKRVKKNSFKITCSIRGGWGWGWGWDEVLHKSGMKIIIKDVNVCLC